MSWGRREGAQASYNVYLEKLIYVVAYVIISQRGVQNFKICTVHKLKYQAWGFRVLISNNVKKLDDIWAPTKVLENFDLSLNLHKRQQQGVLMLPLCTYYKCILKSAEWGYWQLIRTKHQNRKP